MSKDYPTTLTITGKDGTRYIIPVDSIKSIVIVIEPLLMNFNLVPEVWQAAGCKAFSFNVGNINTIKKFLADFRKCGGRCPVRYVR